MNRAKRGGSRYAGSSPFAALIVHIDRRTLLGRKQPGLRWSHMTRRSPALLLRLWIPLLLAVAALLGPGTGPGRRPGARSALRRRTRARRGTGRTSRRSQPLRGRRVVVPVRKAAVAAATYTPPPVTQHAGGRCSADEDGRRAGPQARRAREEARRAAGDQDHRRPARCASTCTAGSEPSRVRSMTTRCCCWPASRCSSRRSLPRRERRSP